MGYAQEFKDNWPTLLASATGLALGAAMNHYASNLFGPALLKDFGWQKSDLALTGMLSMLGMFFVPVAGRFTDRFSARAAASIGCTVIAGTYFAYSLMTGPIWLYFAIMAVHILFAVLTTTIVFARVIVERFDAARGMALSLLMTGPSLAAALLTPFLADIIAADGWRTGYKAMAALTLVAGAIAIALPACTAVTLTSESDGSAGLGETVYVDGPKVTPLSVIEDSRCPKDVQCVWPGRVVLSIRIDGGSKSFVRSVESGKPEPVFDGTLTLESVLPERPKSRDIAPEDYRFRFRFAGGI